MTDPPPLPEPLAQQLPPLVSSGCSHTGQLEPAARDRLGQQLAGIDWRQVAAMRRLAADDNTAAALPVDAAWLRQPHACRRTAASRRPEPSGLLSRCGCRSRDGPARESPRRRHPCGGGQATLCGVKAPKASTRRSGSQASLFGLLLLAAGNRHPQRPADPLAIMTSSATIPTLVPFQPSTPSSGSRLSMC